MPQAIAASAYVLQNGHVIAVLSQADDAPRLVETLEKDYPLSIMEFRIEYVNPLDRYKTEIWKKRATETY